MPENFFIRLLDMRRQFINEHGREPDELHISHTDKYELIKSVPHYSKEISQRLDNGDVKIETALPEIHGLPVIYGSEETKYV